MDFWRNLATQPAVNRASEVATDVAHAAAAQLNEMFGSGGTFLPHQQQHHQSQQQQQSSGSGGPPPASLASLRQLPTISVTAEDLVEPSNRECCICFEE